MASTRSRPTTSTSSAASWATRSSCTASSRASPRRAEAEEEAEGHAIGGVDGHAEAAAVELAIDERHGEVDVDRRLRPAEPVGEEAQRVADVEGGRLLVRRVRFAGADQARLGEHGAADAAHVERVQHVEVELVREGVAPLDAAERTPAAEQRLDVVAAQPAAAAGREH